MKKYLLIVLAGIALMLAVPQSASTAPISPAGLGAAADAISTTEQVWHRRWHRRHYRVYRYRVYRRHCWHRRYWSGRRCW